MSSKILIMLFKKLFPFPSFLLHKWFMLVPS